MDKSMDISMDISQSFVPLNCHIVSSADTERRVNQSINQFLSSGTTARSTESHVQQDVVASQEKTS